MPNEEVLNLAVAGGGLEVLDKAEILHANGRTVVTRIGLRVSLKYRNGDTVKARKSAVLAMLSFYDIFKEQLTHWLPTTGGSLRRIEDGQIPPIEQPEALAALGTHYGSKLFGYKREQRTNEPALLAAGISCYWDKDPMKNSNFEAHIPLSWCVSQGYDRVSELVSQWSSQVNAVHGTAGISLLFTDDSVGSYLPYSYFLLKKFPGLDYEDPVQFSVQVNSAKSGGPKPFKIRTISWLTVLGETIIAELGGREKMKAELGPECPMFDYQGGTIIRAMPVPELGSSEDGIVPEGYKRVARLTKNVRFEGYTKGLFENLPSPLDNLHETMLWIRRFD